MKYYTEAIYLFNTKTNKKDIDKTLISFEKVKEKTNPYIYKIVKGKMKKIFSKEKILVEIKKTIKKMVEKKQTIFINTNGLSKINIEFILKNITYPSYFIDDIDAIHIEPKHKIFKDKIDVIGDIHGLYEPFIKLLKKMGYYIKNNKIEHPDNRKIVFLGDIINKGNDSLKVLKLIMNSVQNNGHYMVLGNHEHKLLELLQNSNANLQDFPKYLQIFTDIRKNKMEKRVKKFLLNLPHYYILNDEFLLVHGNLKQFNHLTTTLQNCIYGNSGDYTDIEYQLKYNNKKIKLTLVRGHTKQKEVCYDRCPNVISLETGCCENGFISGIQTENLYKLNKSKIVKVATNYFYKETT